MPQVASALKTHAPNRPLASRPAPAADRTANAPFASLLDDSASGPDRPAQPVADDKAARPTHSDSAQTPAKATDSKAAKAKDEAGSTDAGKDAKDAKADKTVGDGKTAAQTDGKDGTPVGDGTAADGLVPIDPTVTPPTDPAPVITTVDAATVALAPAVVAPTTPAAENTATIATPTKVDVLAALHAGDAKAAGNKPTDDPALAAKAATQPQGEVKPQGSASDADKDAIARARGGLTESGHHAAGPHGPGELAIDTSAATPKIAADAAQPTGLTAPSQTPAPAAPSPVASAPTPQPVAIPLAGVAIEIAGKALAGKNHFEIRLDPPELGRIEVRLAVDRDGNVTSRMIADRADTLDLLRRDASGLERALQDAGLKTSDNGLQFSLRDQSPQQQQQSNTGAQTAQLVVQDETLPSIDVTQRSYSRLAGLGSGVDIQV